MSSTNLIEDLRLLSPTNYAVWWTLAIAVAIALGIVLLMRKRMTVGPDQQHETAGPALWDLALAELERLTSLLKAEHSRDYAIESTTILRGYVEARYGFRAPKLATEEFLHLAGVSPALPTAHRASLRDFLEMCDLLKFARYVAKAAELEKLHAAAVGFVIASRPDRSVGQVQKRSS